MMHVHDANNSNLVVWHIAVDKHLYLSNSLGVPLSTWLGVELSEAGENAKILVPVTIKEKS